ncbi:MAG: hypothetical protein AAF436_13165 [Myxococcota bacterium]
MRLLILFMALPVLMLGCGYPAYTSAMRTNFEGDVAIWTQCYRYGDKESVKFASHMDKLSKEGWRLAYVSEYTSTSRSKFYYTVCVERARDTTTPPAGTTSE